jgi:antitoxin HicB
MQFVYPVNLEEDHSGPPETHGFLVTFPDLPEAITSGCDRAEALANAIDCLEVALAGRINDREDITPPAPAEGRPTVAPGQLIAAKAALWLAMRAQHVHAAELARRMGVERPAINRLLDPRHASKPDQFDAAFRALGKRLVLFLEDAA